MFIWHQRNTVAKLGLGHFGCRRTLGIHATSVHSFPAQICVSARCLLEHSGMRLAYQRQQLINLRSFAGFRRMRLRMDIYLTGYLQISSAAANDALTPIVIIRGLWVDFERCAQVITAALREDPLHKF